MRSKKIKAIIQLFKKTKSVKEIEKLLNRQSRVYYSIKQNSLIQLRTALKLVNQKQ